MKLYYGVIENNKDPKKLGRVQVRVVGIHPKDKSLVPVEDLIWSLCMGPVTSPGISGLGHSTFLVQGAWVVGMFTDEDYQDFMVIGSLPTISSKIAPNKEKGFTDPDGVYPKKQDEPDSNERTREDDHLENTLIMRELFDKDGNVVGEAQYYQVDNLQTLQPPTSYAPAYPHNHVYATESGHFKEYDDTEGAERIIERHKAGSYYEIQPNGSKIEQVVNNNYKVVFGHDTLEVTGNVKVIVSGNSDVEIKGNANLTVGGTYKADIGGTCDITSVGDMTLVAPNIHMNP